MVLIHVFALMKEPSSAISYIKITTSDLLKYDGGMLLNLKFWEMTPQFLFLCQAKFTDKCQISGVESYCGRAFKLKFHSISFGDPKDSAEQEKR